MVTPFMGVRGVVLPLLVADEKVGSAAEDEGPAGSWDWPIALSCWPCGAAMGLLLGEEPAAAGKLPSGLLPCLLVRLSTTAPCSLYISTAAQHLRSRLPSQCA